MMSPILSFGVSLDTTLGFSLGLSSKFEPKLESRADLGLKLKPKIGRDPWPKPLLMLRATLQNEATPKPGPRPRARFEVTKPEPLPQF